MTNKKLRLHAATIAIKLDEALEPSIQELQDNSDAIALEITAYVEKHGLTEQDGKDLAEVLAYRPASVEVTL